MDVQTKPEFYQAIREVVGSLGPVLERHPEFVEEKVIERICEPDRQILFRVAWEDDEGEVHVNRGFRVEFACSDSGGVVYDEAGIDLDTVKPLCYETAQEYGTPGNYFNGANIAGFLKVARATMAQGIA